jgi:hypothetical protein
LRPQERPPSAAHRGFRAAKTWAGVRIFKMDYLLVSATIFSNCCGKSGVVELSMVI